MNTKYNNWFDSKYYHILYKNRNHKEAKVFIKKLLKHINLNSYSKVLDAGCGKGRHSIEIEKLGHKVTGIDLSNNSIKFAKKFENSNLKFKVHDISKPLNTEFDVVLNLFTSFGYFENDMDDILVLKNIHKGLHKNGLLVLDFLNVVNVEKKLVKKEVKIVDEITFNLQREIKDGFILKHITFTDKGVNHSFSERVKYLTLKKFESYFFEAGLKINHIFGDYHLTKFNPVTSERLIFVVS